MLLTCSVTMGGDVVVGLPFISCVKSPRKSVLQLLWLGLAHQFFEPLRLPGWTRNNAVFSQ